MSLQKEIDHRTAMITMLEQSELFYEDQYREAKIVANVSKDKWYFQNIRTLSMVDIRKFHVPYGENDKMIFFFFSKTLTHTRYTDQCNPYL